MNCLSFYYGSMNSGKSTHLIQKVHNYRTLCMEVKVFTSSLDTRSGTGLIKSRIGISTEAEVLCNGDYAVLNKFIQDMWNGSQVRAVFVDECQFLDEKSIDMLSDICDDFNIPVYCYGIRTDFSTALFSGSARLMEIADNIIELHNLCQCGCKATVNARLVDSTEQILIGAEDMYKSMCRKCYKKFKSSKA